MPTKRVDRKAIRYALHVSWIPQFYFQNDVPIRQSQKFEPQLLSLHSFTSLPSKPQSQKFEHQLISLRSFPPTPPITGESEPKTIHGWRHTNWPQQSYFRVLPWRGHFPMHIVYVHNGAIPRSRQSTVLNLWSLEGKRVNSVASDMWEMSNNLCRKTWRAYLEEIRLYVEKMLKWPSHFNPSGQCMYYQAEHWIILQSSS